MAFASSLLFGCRTVKSRRQLITVKMFDLEKRHVENDELALKIKAEGHRIGNSAMREDGMLLYQVDDVFMFRPDAVDLANGAATLEDIIKRNKGKVFPNAPME